MIIQALVRYKILGDDNYTYIEPFTIKYKSDNILRLDFCWRANILSQLVKRRIVVSEITTVNVKITSD